MALSSLAVEARDLGTPEVTDDLDAASRHAESLLARGVELLDVLRGSEPDEIVAEDAFDMFGEVDIDLEPPSEPTGPNVADLCFAGLLEIRAALRGLAEAKRPSDRISAIEMAGRKLRSSLRAVLSLASIGTEAPTELPQNEELVSALASRRAYAVLRRNLRRADSDTPAAVLRAIQYGAGALAALASSSDYAMLVESDRAALRDLHGRSFAWARGSRDVGDGLLLLEDLHTTADLLIEINQRAELRGHDRLVIAKLAEATTNDERYDAVLSLVGRDDALDRLIIELGETSDFEVVWSLVVLRLGALP